MANLKVFNDSVVELPEQAAAPHGLTVTAARAVDSQEVMPLTFSLKIPQELHDELEAKVAKGIVVPIDEINTKYAVPAKAVDTLVTWLKGQGFEVTQVAKDGTSVYTRATAAQIEKSLGVNMVRVTKGGLTYTAARNAPSLPAEIAGNVHAILGLQPFRHLQKHLRSKHLAQAAAKPANNKPPYKVRARRRGSRRSHSSIRSSTRSSEPRASGTLPAAPTEPTMPAPATTWSQGSAYRISRLW